MNFFRKFPSLLPLGIFLLLLSGLVSLALWVRSTHEATTLPAALAPSAVGTFLDPALGCSAGQACIVLLTATWCPACREQESFLRQADFKARAEKAGYHVVYVVYKPRQAMTSDQEAMVKALAHSYKEDTQGLLSISLGSQGFPETFVTDAQHSVVSQYKGPLVTKESLNSLLTL